jgi:hypothetical protein
LSKIGGWISSAFTFGESEKIPDQSKIDNSLLNLTITTSPDANNANADPNTFTNGTVKSGGDYSINMPSDVLNKDGLNNQEASKITSNEIRQGANTLTQNDNSGWLEQTANFLQQNLVQPIADLGSSVWSGIQSSFSSINNLFFDAPKVQNADHLILDLNGNKLELIAFKDSKVSFDVDNDNYKENTGWVSNQDCILVEDQNQDGKIDKIHIFKKISDFFSKSLRAFASVIFCSGIFIENSLASPEYWPVDDKVVNEIAEFSKGRTQMDITTAKLIEQIVKNNNLDPTHKSADQCELMNKITTYIGLNEVSLGSNGSICSKNNEACITPYRIVKSIEVYKNGFYEDDNKFNSELIHLVTDSYGRPIGISRLFTKPYAKSGGYYQILQHHRKLPESNNSLQEITYSGKKPDNGSYLKIDRCYIKEIHLVLNELYIARPVRYNQ